MWSKGEVFETSENNGMGVQYKNEVLPGRGMRQLGGGDLGYQGIVTQLFSGGGNNSVEAMQGKAMNHSARDMNMHLWWLIATVQHQRIDSQGTVAIKTNKYLNVEQCLKRPPPRIWMQYNRAATCYLLVTCSSLRIANACFNFPLLATHSGFHTSSGSFSQ